MLSALCSNFLAGFVLVTFKDNSRTLSVCNVLNDSKLFLLFARVRRASYLEVIESAPGEGVDAAASSTAIRDAVRRGDWDALAALTYPSVAEYLRERGIGFKE